MDANADELWDPENMCTDLWDCIRRGPENPWHWVKAGIVSHDCRAEAIKQMVENMRQEEMEKC
jgi:hypothetical protein